MRIQEGRYTTVEDGTRFFNWSQIVQQEEVWVDAFGVERPIVEMDAERRMDALEWLREQVVPNAIRNALIDGTLRLIMQHDPPEDEDDETVIERAKLMVDTSLSASEEFDEAIESSLDALPLAHALRESPFADET
jgi:hypothetical protein